MCVSRHYLKYMSRKIVSQYLEIASMLLQFTEYVIIAPNTRIL